MSPRERIIKDVRQLLEQKYLASIGDQPKHKYARLSESEKMEVLRAFLQKRIAGAKTGHWAKVLQDILGADHPPTPSN
jgi:hypothetical protein